MGRPSNFPQSNFTWKGWPADEDREEVLDLPAYRDENQTISCWALTADELAEVQKTGKVWLHIVGAGHPPVAVMGTDPWTLET